MLIEERVLTSATLCRNLPSPKGVAHVGKEGRDRFFFLSARIRYMYSPARTVAISPPSFFVFESPLKAENPPVNKSNGCVRRQIQVDRIARL